MDLERETDTLRRQTRPKRGTPRSNHVLKDECQPQRRERAPRRWWGLEEGNSTSRGSCLALFLLCVSRVLKEINFLEGDMQGKWS